MTRLIRNPDLLIGWRGSRLFIEDLRHKRGTLASSEVVTVLDVFESPSTLTEAAKRLPRYEPRSVLRTARALERAGLLLTEKALRRRLSLLDSWKGNLASALYHVASRDRRYLKSHLAIDRFLLKEVVPRPRPAPLKQYPMLPLRPLTGPSLSTVVGELGRALDARRTVRDFSRRPVPLEDLAILVRGTWGQTGWLDGGALGPLVIKRSPSAGALHPIECYVFAFNVSGLAQGLYHYDVASGGLRLLRRGDFRAAAVAAASGQRWVGRAAFVCIMTAMFSRTLWKYDDEVAFKVLWLDAGHLAQTFCLLATSRGLGPFTTAAIQDSYIEKLIGLDGVAEFPVYLCGAGMPARRSPRPAPKSTSRPPRRIPR